MCFNYGGDFKMEDDVLFLLNCNGEMFYYTTGQIASDKRRMMGSCEKIITIRAKCQGRQFFVNKKPVEVNVDLSKIHESRDNEIPPIRFRDPDNKYILSKGGRI
jgi:hypothetical protein